MDRTWIGSLALTVILASVSSLWGGDEPASTDPARPSAVEEPVVEEPAIEGLLHEELIEPHSHLGGVFGQWAWSVPAAPRWTVEVDTIFLHRSDVDETLVIEYGTEEELLNASELELDWGAGPRVDVIRHFDSGAGFQVVYFGIDSWSADAALTDPANLKVPIFVDRNFVVDDIYARYGSDLYSLEFNYRWPVARRRSLLGMLGVPGAGCADSQAGCGDPCTQCCKPCLTLLAGFRWIELRENAFFETSFTEVIDPFVWGNFDVDNHLHGAQIGAEAVVWDRGGPLTVEVASTVGIYGNRVNRSAFASGDLGNRGFGDAGEHTAFVGEIAIKGNFYITQNLAAVAGFELLWLDGVALAPIQELAPMEATGTIVYGTAFYHGVFMGLEGRF
ncbi:MAG TPA: hypothetical protein EYP56_19515 [Planctomycetaceae bacterium]|nr:hypothetical protein [Planctomycetaceae bacterium]